MRESRSFSVVRALRAAGAHVHAIDPLVTHSSAAAELKACGAQLLREREVKEGAYDVVIVCVPHKQFKELGVRGLSRFLRRAHGPFIADPFRTLREAHDGSKYAHAMPIPKGAALLGMIEPDFLLPLRPSISEQLIYSGTLPVLYVVDFSKSH